MQYLIVEAVTLKVKREDAEAAKEAEKAAKVKEWKKDTSKLDQFR